MSSHPNLSQQHEQKRHFLSARDRRLLVFGYPRRVTSREVETLVRFLLEEEEEEDEEQRGDKRDPGDEKNDNNNATTTTIKVLDELDAHGCTNDDAGAAISTARE